MTLIRSTVGRPCPVCNTSQCACGGPTTGDGIDPLRPEELTVSGHPIHEYDVNVNGYDTILNLSEDEAKRLHPGAKRRSGPVAPDHPDNTRSDGEDDGAGRVGGKARSAPNKGA